MNNCSRIAIIGIMDTIDPMDIMDITGVPAIYNLSSSDNHVSLF
jgi:hypothetical protein